MADYESISVKLKQQNIYISARIKSFNKTKFNEIYDH